MVASRKSSTLLSTVQCQFLLIALSAIQTTLGHGSTSLGNPNSVKDQFPNSAVASKLSPFSKLSDGEFVHIGSSDASSDDMSSAVLTSNDREKYEPSVSQSSAQQTSKLDHRVRTKRTWKNNRVQAAWGKRSNIARPADSTLWRRIKVSDARLRRKWSQVGRQAWGKRNHVASEADDQILEPELTSNDNIVDESLARNRRKWGVGSAKAAWGKRSWGELASESANEDDKAGGQTGGRSKRSVVDGSMMKPLIIEDRWISSRVPVEKLVSRLRQPMTGTPSRSRDEQTNSRHMGLLVKSPDYRTEDYVGLSADSVPVEYGYDGDLDESLGSPYVWDEVDNVAINEKADPKKKWLSDKSLRIWAK